MDRKENNNKTNTDGYTEECDDKLVHPTCLRTNTCQETEGFKGTEHEGVDVCEDGCAWYVPKSLREPVKLRDKPLRETYGIHLDGSPVYDPFESFGPGKRVPQPTCKHRGRWKNLCKCPTAIDGGIGRVFMNDSQLEALYSWWMNRPQNEIVFITFETFRRKLIHEGYTIYGHHLIYRP